MMDKRMACGLSVTPSLPLGYPHSSQQRRTALQWVLPLTTRQLQEETPSLVCCLEVVVAPRQACGMETHVVPPPLLLSPPSMMTSWQT